MAAPILQLKEIELSIGGTQLFAGVNLSVEPRTRVCLVGRNGSGKSTLMKVIAGLMEPDQGEVFIQPGVKVAYMPQEPNFPADTTSLQYVASQDEATEYMAEQILVELGIPKDRLLDNLSGGEGRRVSLAYALVNEPDILMLDEPTNHLDVATIEYLEKKVKGYNGSIILISHDRTFLSNTTNATLWLDQGKVRRLSKGYQHFEEWSEKILEEETKARIKMDKLIEQETEWSHKGITARRKRNQGRLRKLDDLRQKRSQQLSALKMARLEAGSPEKSARHIIEARHIHKAYGDKVLIKDFTTNITRGDRIGIIGPNGTGKTTLLKMLIGELKPDSGKLKINKRLEMVYLDQNRTALDPTKTLWQILCPNGGDFVYVQGRQRHVVAYLKDFLFHPDQIRSPIRVLSGGEKNRLLLAMSLAQESNILVLDEPTNDLDMDTLDRLQDMLCNYDGTLIVVTHDRSFLDNVVTSTIVLEGDGNATEYAGGYKDYLRQKKGAQKPTKPKKEPEKEAKKPEPKKVERPTKLSFKHHYALKELPKQIAEIEGKIEKIESALNNPNIYLDDSLRAEDLAAQLSQLKSQKDDLETQWLEVELLKEEIEP